jgi:hypothetical protein
MTDLFITNRDPNDWGTVTIYINGRPPSGFKKVLGTLRAGQTAEISLMDCVNEDSKRFQPLQEKVTEVWIGGGGYDYQGYDIRN